MRQIIGYILLVIVVFLLAGMLQDKVEMCGRSGLPDEMEFRCAGRLMGTLIGHTFWAIVLYFLIRNPKDASQKSSKLKAAALFVGWLLLFHAIVILSAAAL